MLCLGVSGEIEEEEQAKAMGKNSREVGVKREEGEWEQMQFSVHPSFQYI